MKRLWRACLVLMAAICIGLGGQGPAEAAPQVIEATGVYIMGDNDSPKIARDAARQEAMRAAVEKAGVYVESYSRTKNMQLTEDDVKMISGAVLKVIKEDSVPELSGTTMKYTVHLTAEVDTDNIDFKALMAKKDEVEKLQQERDALKKQNEELLQEYQKANGQEKKKLGTRLETSYDYGKIFDRSMGNIQRSEYTKAIDELTTLIEDRRVTGNPRAYAYYLRGAPTTASTGRTKHSRISVQPTRQRTITRRIPSGAATSTKASSTTTRVATTTPCASSRLPGTTPTSRTRRSPTTCALRARPLSVPRTRHQSPHRSPMTATPAAQAAASTGQRSSPTSSSTRWTKADTIGFPPSGGNFFA